MHFALSHCRLPSPSVHFPFLTFNSLKSCSTAALATSSWVAFRWLNSPKLLLPPNPILLLSLYSVAASQGRKLCLGPESFRWLKTSYMELWRRAKQITSITPTSLELSFLKMQQDISWRKQSLTHFTLYTKLLVHWTAIQTGPWKRVLKTHIFPGKHKKTSTGSKGIILIHFYCTFYKNFKLFRPKFICK